MIIMRQKLESEFVGDFKEFFFILILLLFFYLREVFKLKKKN